MSPPNGVYIIQGEVSLVVTAMRRTSRWTTHSHLDEEADPLLSSFSQLKDVLNNVTVLSELEPNVFLSPFLEVIRSEDTTGPITGLALTSVNKFLSYGLVDPTSEMAAAAIENVADAVTHARFVGTDPSSDEVVLMKILHVLRTMLLCPSGILLTNESVCEIMQSCFRICFEMRLSELLRKAAEHTLMDMVQLLFTRLPQFKEDTKWSANMKKLKMRAGVVDPSRLSKRKRSPKPRPKKNHLQQQQLQQQQQNAEGNKTQTMASENAEDVAVDITPQMEVSEFEHVANDRIIATTPVAPSDDGVIDISKSFEAASREEQYQVIVPQSIKEQITEATDRPPTEGADQGEECQSEVADYVPCDTPCVTLTVQEESVLKKCPSDSELTSDLGDDNESIQSTTDSIDTSSSFQESDFINPKGVRFTQIQGYREGSYPLIPYGLPCVRELYRFLVSLTNPIDRHNTDVMIHMGLSLLTVALEAGADHISSFNSLLYLVKDEMCRNLFMLLQTERLSLFAASLRVCFLLFESMRSHLKLQLEMFLIKLSDIVISESPKVSYEVREITLESIVQLWRIPGLVTELYLNYDCDLYCSNLFEELTKLLSKNAFPVSGLFTTHLLSLDALLTVIDTIEQHCHTRILSSNKTASSGGPADSEDKVSNDSPESRTNEPGTDYENNPSESRLLGPPTSGYCMAQQAKQYTQDWTKSNKLTKDNKKGPQIKPNRMRITSKIPTSDEIAIIKHKKKLYQMGTELFNTKPSKAITFLQEQGLLATPLEPGQVVTFLKENPKLDKKMIGEYIANKKNKNVLEAFVKSFNFEDIRIDEALRMYLEAFRLPGEAPVISFLMEHFADHWHKMNGEPFANSDAAFTLSYAIIMLNVDQHNHNVKKQNTPMTVAEFKKNVSKTNGGEDFDQDMLEDIYTAIRNEEIVMPAEHTGLVKENYYWKVLLRRGATKEGIFLHSPAGSFDHELFSLVWGSTVAAMSFVFDKSSDESIIQKSIAGFRKCAMISAHYGMSDVFDNLVISLCKFTTLLSSPETPENIPASFGTNLKAQLAARTVFGLAHRHGDILREGWKNIMDCMLQLYRAKLLPKTMIEVEDFADDSGKICIMREDNTSSQRSESGVLSSFYSYFSLSDSASQKGPSPEEQEAFRQSQSVIRDCHLDLLILDSKFLREDSLQELVKALIMACQGSEDHNSVGTQYDEDSTVFFLELLIRVVLQNRDRVSPIWQSVRDHLYNIIVNATEHTFLVERAVVGLLRLAIRLLRREDIAPQVLTSLRMLLMMRPNVIHSMSRQVAYGLHDLLKTNAANIHSSTDWFTLFIVLEVVGAGANPPPIMQVCSGVDVADVLYDAGTQSDSEVSSRSCHTDISDRGYTSDSELYESQSKHQQESTELHLRPIPDNGSWMLVNKEETVQPPRKRSVPVNQFSIDLKESLQYCDSKALQKSSETLSFLVRDAAHVTPHNFESCVHAIRTFVEASLNGGHLKVASKPHSHEKKTHRKSHRSKKESSSMKKSQSSPSHLSHHNMSDDECETESAGLHSLSIQLLDLMHTLHTRAATIFSSWAKEEKESEEKGEHIDAGMSTLWAKCWCPLLQGIARLCCDSRRQVRSQALTYLQRALLVHDLQTLSAVEWEACFNKVWFPLLTKLLENISPQDPSGMEETRMRASTLLCKVFLQHLSPLLSLSTFTALWLTILDFMEKYMKADSSDLLSEAIPESLKNMLLVMDTAAIFQTGENMESQLWKLTWDKIDTFLPNLKGELFKPFEPEVKKIDRCENNSADGNSSQTSARDVSGESKHDSVQLETVTVVEQSCDSSSTSPPRPTSPLMPVPHESAPGSAYILHPPLPNITTPTPGQPSGTNEPHNEGYSSAHIPLLLNPDIMQSTSVPYITPQAQMNNLTASSP